MPIQGLTNRPPQFRCIGTLRKGAPKPDRGPGKDLSYFRFDSDDQRAREMFARAYGDEPRQVTVYLPYATTDQNFSAWQESWTAAQLNHRCDGEVCYSYDGHGRLVPNGQPCPDKGKPSTDRNRCKQVGRLQVIVPALERFAYVTVLTSSIHDIIALSEQLSAIEALRGSLQGVPLILSRHEREISMPKPDGSRQRVTKWMLAIEVAPEWAALQLQSMHRQALFQSPAAAGPSLPGTGVAVTPAPALRALPAGRQVDPATGEIIEPSAPAAAAEDEPAWPLWDEHEDGVPVDEAPAGAVFTPQPEAAPTPPANPVATAVEAAPPTTSQALADELRQLWQRCADLGIEVPSYYYTIDLERKTTRVLREKIAEAQGWIDATAEQQALTV